MLYRNVVDFTMHCTHPPGMHFSIGWRFVDIETPVSILAMERNPNRKQHKVDLVLSRQEREALLIEWGFTVSEIVESIRATIRIKHQRRRTVNNARYERVWEDVVVKPASRIKRKFRNKSNATKSNHHYPSHSMDVPVNHNDLHSGIDSTSYIGDDDGSNTIEMPPNVPPHFVDDEALEDDEGVFLLDEDDGVVYVNHENQEEISSAGNNTLGSDGNFDLLSRDTSFWELERNNPMYPKIARRAVAIVESDEPMDDYNADTETQRVYSRAPFFLPNYASVSRWE